MLIETGAMTLAPRTPRTAAKDCSAKVGADNSIDRWLKIPSRAA
jgi:hypothetical protein